MASVFVLLEAFNRKEAAALGFFSLCNSLFGIDMSTQVRHYKNAAVGRN